MGGLPTRFQFPQGFGRKVLVRKRGLLRFLDHDGNLPRAEMAGVAGFRQLRIGRGIFRLGAGSGSTSLHIKSRTQDSLFSSWPNMLPRGGSEVVLFYIND